MTTTETSGTDVPDFDTIDFYTDPSLVEDPYPYFEHWREKCPVAHWPHHGVIAVTGYEESAEIYRQPDVFSSANAVTGPFPGLPVEPEGDDITDLIEEVADLFVLYKIEAPMLQAQELAHLLALSCAEIAQAMPLLRTFGDFSAHVVEVNRLENAGDRVSRDAVASLFDAGIDPMVVIRWKDVFERLEEGIDATERTANVLEGIRIKNG